METKQLNLKALRRAVRDAADEHKKMMFGRRSCTDVGGRKWCLEYGVQYWRPASPSWGAADWDDYASANSQRNLFKDVASALASTAEKYDHVVVAVRLICSGRVNEQTLLEIDGSKLQQ